MALILDTANGPALDVDEVAARLDARGIDLSDPESVQFGADLLAGLGRNRTFLADRVMAELKSCFDRQVADNRYSAQVFLLYRSGRRHYLRANIWPSVHDDCYRASGSAHFAYGLPHDHNFSFLTVGYHGPGYTSDDYEHDGAALAGYPGEPMPLRSAGRSALTPGTVMLYRAHRDIHRQSPPDALSVSLNIMEEGEHIPWRDQYIIDVDRGAIARAPSLSQSEALLRAAVHLAGDEGRDVAAQFAAYHPIARVRGQAILAMAAAAVCQAERMAVLERGLRDDSARVRHLCLQQLNPAPVSSTMEKNGSVAARHADWCD